MVVVVVVVVVDQPNQPETVDPNRTRPIVHL